MTNINFINMNTNAAAPSFGTKFDKSAMKVVKKMYKDTEIPDKVVGKMRELNSDGKAYLRIGVKRKKFENVKYWAFILYSKTFKGFKQSLFNALNAERFTDNFVRMDLPYEERKLYGKISLK